MGPKAVARRPWCAVQADFGDCAKEKHLVRWAQAATEGVLVAFFRGKPLQPFLRVGKLARWS
jgi:hypothetical protein